MRLWDARSGEALGAPLTGHEGPVRAVAFGAVDGAPLRNDASLGSSTHATRPVTINRLGCAQRLSRISKTAIGRRTESYPDPIKQGPGGDPRAFSVA